MSGVIIRGYLRLNNSYNDIIMCEDQHQNASKDQYSTVELHDKVSIVITFPILVFMIQANFDY